MAKLPNCQYAEVDIVKLESYCLNLNHVAKVPGKSSGRDHALVFQRVLGIEQHHANVLKNELLKIAQELDATEKNADKHGQRYEIRFPMTGPSGRTAEVISAWILEWEGRGPRLSSCYVAGN